MKVLSIIYFHKKTINLNSRTTTSLQLTLQSMPRQKGVIDEDDEDEKDHFAISKEGEEYEDAPEAKKMVVIFQICTRDENDDHTQGQRKGLG